MKYTLIAAILLFVIHKAYWVIFIAGLSHQEKLQYALGLKKIGTIGKVINAGLILSYILCVISVVLFIINYL